MKAGILILLVCGSAAAQDIKVEGTLGSVDPVAVQLAVDKSSAGIEACFKDNAGTLRFVGGAVKLRLRVARDGVIKSAAVTGDLGAWEVEKCLVKLARGLRFGKPRGGEAEIELPLDFPARGAAGAGDGEELAAKVAALAACHGGPHAVDVTAYVGPGGKIMTAGFSSEEPLSEAWGDCALAKARGLRLRDPRGKVVKIAARLP